MIPRFFTILLFSFLFLGSLCAQTQFIAYECKHQSASQLERLIRPQLPAGEGIQLVIDQQQNRLLLSGSDSVHAAFRSFLKQSDVPFQKPLLPLANQVSIDKDTAADPTETLAIPIDADGINSLVVQFERIFGKRLTTITPGRVYELSVRDPDVRTSLIFDTNNRRMVLSGPSRIVGQLKALVERLSSQPGNGFRVQVHRLQRESHSSLRDAVRSINDERSVPGRAVLPNDQTRFMMPPGSMIRPVVFQTISDQGDGEVADQALRQFEGVEIESLPDLDVILLRGRQPDLDQLA
ncbi:MAG: secretin N-terminal domain-containing protein, partial [Rubripirellula sp.]